MKLEWILFLHCVWIELKDKRDLIFTRTHSCVTSDHWSLSIVRLMYMHKHRWFQRDFQTPGDLWSKRYHIYQWNHLLLLYIDRTSAQVDDYHKAIKAASFNRYSPRIESRSTIAWLFRFRHWTLSTGTVAIIWLIIKQGQWINRSRYLQPFLSDSSVMWFSHSCLLRWLYY